MDGRREKGNHSYLLKTKESGGKSRQKGPFFQNDWQKERNGLLNPILRRWLAGMNCWMDLPLTWLAGLAYSCWLAFLSILAFPFRPNLKERKKVKVVGWRNYVYNE